MSDDAIASPVARADRSNFRTTALIIASAMFMEQFDATSLATALPTMARTFGVSPTHMSIALTSYLVALAVFIPASAVVADRFGARTVFRLAILVFTIGSILCAQADSLSFFVAARVLQGIGGAMMMPIGRLVLLKSVAKSELVAAMTWLLVPALIGPIVGPPVGGFIVTWLDWRWIFYVNVPIGVIGIVLVTLFIDDVREDRPARFDGVGLLLSGLSLGCLLFGFEMSSRGEVGADVIALLFVVGIAAGALYIRHARRHADPVLDLTLMRVPTFNLSLVAGSLTRITQGGLPFLLPLMMQVGFGMSAAESGLITFATAAGAMLVKLPTTPILRRFGFRTTLIWNAVIASTCYALCAAFRPDWPLWLIYLVLGVAGFFQSLQFTAYNTVAYAEIPRERMSTATSFYTTFQQLMLSFGICVAALAVHVSTLFGGRAQANLWDFSVAFLVVTAISVLAAPVSARLPKNAGADISGHRRRAKG